MESFVGYLNRRCNKVVSNATLVKERTNSVNKDNSLVIVCLSVCLSVSACLPAWLSLSLSLSLFLSACLSVSAVAHIF